MDVFFIYVEAHPFIAHNGFVVTGQSYEIRMLDNRKIGELPEITGKMVKVRITKTY